MNTKRKASGKTSGMIKPCTALQLRGAQIQTPPGLKAIFIFKVPDQRYGKASQRGETLASFSGCAALRTRDEPSSSSIHHHHPHFIPARVVHGSDKIRIPAVKSTIRSEKFRILSDLHSVRIGHDPIRRGVGADCGFTRRTQPTPHSFTLHFTTNAHRHPHPTVAAAVALTTPPSLHRRHNPLSLLCPSSLRHHHSCQCRLSVTACHVPVAVTLPSSSLGYLAAADCCSAQASRLCYSLLLVATASSPLLPW
ncbi:hypothetical protein PIB30_057823 [Stylosanthes scabra]|uniref:Uncharacterized protein n=1 Tax=Stylosanthes scabra TaxID=79078 RepID=A0ABU6RK19_9FABA|nr:hypothetical protein [Stylosanthes scabra]